MQENMPVAGTMYGGELLFNKQSCGLTINKSIVLHL